MRFCQLDSLADTHLPSLTKFLDETLFTVHVRACTQPEENIKPCINPVAFRVHPHQLHNTSHDILCIVH